MKDKTEQILDASIQVFMEKGYKGASTKAIADQAGVAEVTLYRKFKNKQALFESAVRFHLEPSLINDRLDPLMDSETFFRMLFEDRIETMSKHRRLMQLVIRESLSGTLPDDLQFVSIMHSSLKRIISEHVTIQGYTVEAPFLTRTVIGILISYILLPPPPDFSMMDDEKKKRTIDTHVTFLLKSLKT